MLCCERHTVEVRKRVLYRRCKRNAFYYYCCCCFVFFYLSFRLCRWTAKIYLFAPCEVIGTMHKHMCMLFVRPNLNWSITHFYRFQCTAWDKHTFMRLMLWVKSIVSKQNIAKWTSNCSDIHRGATLPFFSLQCYCCCLFQ